jgi:hypothetical protein
VGTVKTIIEKLQVPNSNIQRRLQFSIFKVAHYAFWSLVIGISLEFGGWDLVLIVASDSSMAIFPQLVNSSPP